MALCEKYRYTFPQTLENLEKESSHGKVIEHEKWPKVIMEFYHFAPKLYHICTFFATKQRW